MFHEGQYLEVIKVSDSCLATVIVTVKEKMVKINNEKVATNKWLNLEDWYELYKILQKAILRNSKASKERDKISAVERKKSTKRLDIVYTIEPPEDIKNKNSLTTVKVRVSQVKRASLRSASNNQSSAVNNKNISVSKNTEKTSKSLSKPLSNSIYSINSPEAKVERLMEDISDSYNPEEYVPTDLPNRQRLQDTLKYVPSRKSFLKKMKQSMNVNSNEYSPTCDNKQGAQLNGEVDYVPNPISSLENVNHDVYDPCGMTSLPLELSQAYVPSSKGVNTCVVEEYQPDFAGKTMKFDNSYVPSLKRSVDQASLKRSKEAVKKKVRKVNETDVNKIRKKLFLGNNSSAKKKKLSSSDSKREL